jgi:tetratricopeptide (TPR) repeat protein
MRQVVSWAVLLACAVAVAQASQNQPAATWLEVRSPNFTVVTDAGEEQGRQVALRFEQMRMVFGTLISRQQVNAPVRLQIVAFRNAAGLRAFAPLWNGKPIDVAGLFLPGTDLSFIALDVSSPHGWTAVFHEYAHMLLDGNLRGKQLWFDEGFAQYYSTIEIGPREVVIGRPPAWVSDYLVKAPRVSLGELFTVTQESPAYNEGEARMKFYAHSWLLVDYLASSNRLKQIGMYFELVDQGVPLEPAVRRAFGMELKQLETAAERHFRSRRFALERHKTPPGIDRFQFSARPLRPADAQAVLADLHLHMADYRKQALEEFEQVLKLDPDHPAANRSLGYAYLGQGEFARAGEHFRRAAAQGSEDPRVHYYSALLMHMVAEQAGASVDNPGAMKQHLQAAIALDPNFSDAYNLLSEACLGLEDLPAAIDAMSRAVQLSPRNEPYATRLASLLMKARKWDQASDVLGRLRNSSDPQMAADARAMLAAIQHIREQEPLPLTEKDLALPPERPKVAVARKPQKKASTELRPIRYLRGRLVRVTCNGNAATLNVMAGEKNWNLRVPDRKKLLLIGADAFSCQWRDKEVLINYRLAGNRAGEAVSLELK